MAEILQKMIDADVLVLASPVYFYSIDAQLKAVIDRTVASWLEVKNKEFYYITTMADNEKSSADTTLACFRGYADCVEGAVEKGAVVAGGVYEKGEIKNTCPVFDRNGEMIAFYDKMHLYSYLGDTENLNSVRGEKPVIATTDVGKIGISICYDIRFPEIYRCYAYGGADILVNMAAWPLSRRLHWETLTRARAIENQSFMIAVSQTGEIQNGIYNIGSSVVLSPLGETIASLEYEEAVLRAEFDLNDMKKLRETVKTLSDRQDNYTLEV